MASNETISMHYVPQCYLRKFTIDKKTIYGVRENTGEVFDDKVKNVCAKNHLYRLEAETKDERQLVEKYLEISGFYIMLAEY